MPGRRRLVVGFLVLVVAAYVVFRGYALTYLRLLWMRDLGYTMIFWRAISARAETALVAGVLFGGFLYLHLRIAAPSLRAIPADALGAPYGGWLRGRRPAAWVGWVAVAVGALAAWILSSQWPTVWFFKDAVPFGATDPVFHRDIGDYVFRLPFYEMVYEATGAAFWVSGLAALGVYFATGWLNFVDGRFLAHPHARAHLFAVLAGYLALKAVGYRLDMWNLLYSAHGVVFPGVSYTDVHVALPILHLLIGGALLTAVFAVLGAAGRPRLVWWGLGGLVGCSLILGSVLPAVVEGVVVRPSQLQRETPYIVNNINATRQAFDLDKIDLEPFPVQTDLTSADLQPFQDTFQNIRLWDWQIASPAFQQLQGLRTYYSFDPVTIDRYTVQGQYRQVLVAAREINYQNLPASTWQNQHMKFTHGFGAVVLPSAEIGPQGMPNFWVQDISDQSSVGLTIQQPRIYYGLATTAYAIVGPQIHEFDYPQGQTDVYNQYDGSGGISISGLFNRLAFALWAGNYNVLFAEGMGQGTKALIYRDLQDRLPRILTQPFLTYDQDPYLVIAGGRLYWMADAYTTSSYYPYATRAGAGPEAGVNYMRNAVKVVVDAYNGSVTYYVADPSDPIIQAEERIFPGAFRPLSAMPADLLAHIRYPEDFFSTQAQLYQRYHMTDPAVFYNNEDIWSLANENIGSTTSSAAGNTATATVPPYYVILQFPNVQGPQFVLMEPFTPRGRDNMAAWMAAFSDGAQYGHVVAYEFPKDQTVYGPLQVESQINQDSDVADILALWTRGGSGVARGNLLVIPIRNSLLYVEPLYQTAASTNLPALRRVIVDYGGQQIAVGVTLDDALSQIFGPLPWAPAAGAGTTVPGQPAQPAQPTQPAAPGASTAADQLLQQAQQDYAAAQQALKNGDFVTYAQKISALGQLLGSATSASGTAAPPAATPAGGSG